MGFALTCAWLPALGTCADVCWWKNLRALWWQKYSCWRALRTGKLSRGWESSERCSWCWTLQVLILVPHGGVWGCIGDLGWAGHLLGLCTDAAGGAGSNVTVLCNVMSHQGCLTSTAVWLLWPELARLDCPGAAGWRGPKALSAGPAVCCVPVILPSAALPLKILFLPQELLSSHFAVLMAHFGQWWV